MSAEASGAFKDVQEKKWDSPYKDWFHINFDGNSYYNDGFWYEGWEGHFELVKLNLKNNDVVEYLFSCIDDWVKEFDIDGLRLDVAYCPRYGLFEQTSQSLRFAEIRLLPCRRVDARRLQPVCDRR